MPDIGYGVTLSVSDVSPAVTPTNTVGAITAFTPPNPTRDIIDVTSSDSPNMAREFIAGLIDYGEAGFDMLWEINNTADALLRAIILERKPRTWRATFNQFSPVRTVTFLGYLTGYERSAPLEDKMTATITIKVTGAPVQA